VVSLRRNKMEPDRVGGPWMLYQLSSASALKMFLQRGIGPIIILSAQRNKCSSVGSHASLKTVAVSRRTSRFSDPILHVHGLGVAASKVCVYPIEHLDVRQPRDRTVLLVDPRQDGVTTRPQIRVLVNV
jgi:hypothetical protein